MQIFLGSIIAITVLIVSKLLTGQSDASERSSLRKQGLPMTDVGCPYNVESWRGLAIAQGLDHGIPVNFILKWIEVESAGNPCAFGSPGAKDAQGNVLESGLFQLYSPDNIQAAKTTVAAMRAGCDGATQVCARVLTADEMSEQMRAGIAYILYCKQAASGKLAAVHGTWDPNGPDYYKMVKLEHGLPALSYYALLAFHGHENRAPTGWAEFASNAASYNYAEEFPGNRGAAALQGYGRDGFLRVLANAAKTGGVVAGGVGV